MNTSLFETITRVENIIRYSPIEHVYLLDKDGNVLYHNIGDEKSVQIYTTDNIIRNTLVSIHNHPNSDTPLSIQDFKANLTFRIPVVRIACLEGSFEVVFSTNFFNSFNESDFENTFVEIKNNIKQMSLQYYGGYDWMIYHHRTLEEIARIYKLNYKFYPC